MSKLIVDSFFKRNGKCVQLALTYAHRTRY